MIIIVNIRSLILTGLGIILLVFVVHQGDLSALPNYIESNKFTIFRFSLLFAGVFLQRVIRTYVLFKMNDFTDASLTEFFGDGIIAGVIATYGPLKSGEIIAIEIYENRFNINRGQSLAVIVASRVVDIVIILSLLITGMLLISTKLVIGMVIYLIILFSILSVIITILLRKDVGYWLISQIEFLFIWKLRALYEGVKNITHSYYKNLENISNKSSIIFLVTISLSRWVSELLFFYLVFQSFHFGLSIIQVIPIVGIFYAIGVSSGTPGGLGTSQLSALGVLINYNIAISDAALALVILTGITIVVNILLFICGILYRLLVRSTQK